MTLIDNISQWSPLHQIKYLLWLHGKSLQLLMMSLYNCLLRYRGNLSTAMNTAELSKLGRKYQLKDTTTISAAPSLAKELSERRQRAVRLRKETAVRTMWGAGKIIHYFLWAFKPHFSTSQTPRFFISYLEWMNWMPNEFNFSWAFSLKTPFFTCLCSIPK